MSQAVPVPTTAVPSRAIEGYAKEMFSSIDASQLPQSIAASGMPLVGGAGNVTYPGSGVGSIGTPVAITDVFMAILVELRSINARLQGFNEGMLVSTNLTNQS